VTQSSTDNDQIYRVDVTPRPGQVDARGLSLTRHAHASGIAGVESIRTGDIYWLAGSFDDATARLLAHVLLHDPIVESATITRGAPGENGPADSAWIVEVSLLPGVTDSVAESLLAGAASAGIGGLAAAATGHRYTIYGDLARPEVERLASGLLANAVIQTYAIGQPVPPPFVAAQAADGCVEIISLVAATGAELETISRARRLSLDAAEMAAIQAYFRTEGREPTDVELEMLAQTWSEHCVHKTFRALIDYEELDADGAPIPGTAITIDSLLKTYIRAATETVNQPWVRSAFVDNAGIIAFDDRYDVAFKVETHNHPSALEPFGGANTGVGGVIRDVIGVSARPIANTDVLCFGPQDLPLDELPAGVLHPRRVADGVTAGVEDYGNKMGIPTVNGAILYDPGYTANPLVFCGCAGILPRGSHRTEPRPGDLVVVIGGRTGRDGLRGATFSSMEMDHQTGQIAGSAVQIGHPIHEKQVLEAVLIARDEGLYDAITDCGAGGLSSAVGEMASELGAEVHLDRVLLKYAGLRPWEIWLSEAQERMVLAIPPDRWPRFGQLCARLDVEATNLGIFTGDGVLTLRYEGRGVGCVHTAFLHNGIPRRRLKANWQVAGSGLKVEGSRLQVPDSGLQVPASSIQHPASSIQRDQAEVALLALLALPNIRSKEDVVRQYDHEVQGGTVVKPFVGPAGQGPSDAAVVVPLDAVRERQDDAARPGIALAAGINPAYTDLDPYAMAWAAVDEAMRNAIAVGADPDRIALLDNFCWGNPLLPDRLGSLVAAARGCHDAAVAYGAPFVSGKDSLNNEYTGADGRKHAIPGTLLISSLGIVPDVRRTVTADLKMPGNRVYILGATRGEMGGSAYAHILERGSSASARAPVELAQSKAVPQPAPTAISLYRALHAAMRDGLVRACHDCSEGGLALAAAEMALAGEVGLALRLADAPRSAEATDDARVAFCESLGRLLVEVKQDDAAAFEAHLAGLPHAAIGETRDDGRLSLAGIDGATLIDLPLAALTDAWRGGLSA
jgi:phosphoribosylformylglycinamidine synthase subunit PurSL